MRTSASQFQILVEYMERYGDLSKPTEGPQGRMCNMRRWAELSQLLNADATGDTKIAERWRKVWSDFKNNLKKKAARIYRAAQGTGGGPASNSKLSDLEQRVLTLMGIQAVTGNFNIPEIGLEVQYTDTVHPTPSETILEMEETCCSVEDWNQPGTSSLTPVFPPLHVGERSEERLVDSEATGVSSPAVIGREDTAPPVVPGGRHHLSPAPTPMPLTPRRRQRGRVRHDPTSPLRRRTRTQTQSDQARQAFIRSDCEWRAFQQENEREKNRLRELELRLEERRLTLYEQVLALGNRVVDILENKK